ncbi:MAG: 50S ribosome-binding GTPase, partial [Clostridia bacterium]|nr:50S ribosome-binding GTPase [Clostridia bacterium]
MADLLSNIPGLDLNKAVEECIRVFNDKIKNMNRLNIVVAGKTGVGKSTLINSIFRENLAETGMGKPVTAHMRK